ncbi:MAG: hypothetical protein IT532_00230 [Burkholderiales bacterium]|nr:hypothetical protein [Burkholderiales bacterium]
MRSGIVTTEFWVTLLTVLASLWGLVEGLLPPETAALVSGIVSVIYTAARAWVKAQHALGELPQVPPLPEVPPGRGTELRAHWVSCALAIALASSLLAGCGALLVQRDTSTMTQQQALQAQLSDAIAAGYVALTQARQLNRELLDDRLIGSVRAQEIRAHLDSARAALDAAAGALVASSPDPPEAQRQLALFNYALSAARALLARQRTE